MNLYQIKYTDNEGSSLMGNFTERDENAARKNFKSTCKGCSLEKIELIRKDVTATKEQEREALATIRQMVEELGMFSYLSTAFAGCFDDAEQNIENDAAFSMKDRYESAVEDANHFKDAANTFSNDLDKADEEIRRLSYEIEALKLRVPSDDDMSDCRTLIREYIFEKENELAAAAAGIVKFAEAPSSPEFAEAVRNHRNISSSLEYYKALDSRIENTIKAGA